LTSGEDTHVSRSSDDIWLSVHTPICLPTPGDNFRQFSSVLTGWGRNVSSLVDESFPFVTILKEITLPITTTATCDTFINSLAGNPPEQQFTYVGVLCVGDGQERGGCFGDSGGPVIVKKDSQTSWTLAGIVSAGAPKCSSVNTYTIAVEISYFTDFINSNINDGTFCYS